MGNLMKETPISEMMATLELFDSLGLKREDLRKLRTNKQQARAVVNLIKQSDDDFFRFHKSTVCAIIELAAGGEHKISESNFAKWSPMIKLAVQCMHDFYFFESTPPKGHEQDAYYYRECWDRLRDAVTEEDTIDAIEYLRASIQFN